MNADTAPAALWARSGGRRRHGVVTWQAENMLSDGVALDFLVGKLVGEGQLHPAVLGRPAMHVLQNFGRTSLLPNGAARLVVMPRDVVLFGIGEPVGHA